MSLPRVSLTPGFSEAMDYAVVLFQRLGNELLEPQLLCLFVLAAGMVVGNDTLFARASGGSVAARDSFLAI